MYFNLIAWFFGFLSGFLLFTTSQALNFWITAEGFKLSVIGLFSLTSLPYTINFLWAPIFDHFSLTKNTHSSSNRYDWLIALNFIIALLLFIVSNLDPKINLFALAIIITLTSFFSASQDTVLNALRSEVIPSSLIAPTSGMYIFGYRIGMIISGPLAIYASAFISWQAIYLTFSIITFSCIIILYSLKKTTLTFTTNHIDLLNPEPALSITQKVFKVIKEIGNVKFVLTLMTFLIFYRLPDNFINVMLNSFFLSTGFKATEIAIAGKLFGILGAIIGGLIAGYLLKKLDLITSLFWFSIIHTFTHLFYVLLVKTGYNMPLLYLTTAVESITSGMMMASYIALITSLCRGKYRATQYSLMSAMMGISRTLLPSISGFTAESLGWISFFISAIVITIPSWILLNKLTYELRVKINAR